MDGHVTHNDTHEFPADEGGLRPPPGLSYWRRMWWWFDFVILVKLARLRFIGILLVIGIIITQWDTLLAYYNKWTRPSAAMQVSGDTEYFCPMHPAVIRDNPKDKCPICFMPLSKRKKGEVASEALPDGVVNRVQLSPYRVVLAGVHTWKVDFQPLVKEIQAVGTVEFNERNQTTVAARMNGRIDELLVSETGQIVSKGDVLASIYSPDLVVTMQNLLQAKKAGNASSINDARTRLELLGISGDQIDDILQSGKANTHLKIRSPISGHIIRKYVREGQYVQEGMALYDVVDLATVWIQAQVYEDDVEFLPVQQVHPTDMAGPEVVATTRAFPNEEFRGRLRFIYPHVDQRTRTLTVRFELDNPGHKLRPGSTATVKLRVSPADVQSLSTAIEQQGDEATQQFAAGNVIAVPDGSVIDTGSQKIVYRETLPGVYEGVQVKLGPKMNDDAGAVFYPVLSGLAAGERVVTSGSFLVDAETRLNPAAGSIYFGGSSGSQGSGPATTVRSTTPEDPDAKIHAALAKLSPDDRKLAEAQRFCPILEQSRLGSMGVPIKLTLDGKTAFICCSGCTGSATKNPVSTLEKVDKLLKKASSKPSPVRPTPLTDKQARLEREIADELAKLSTADRRLVEQQRFCVVSEESRLGSMGAPIKLMIGGEPVFLCCEGCERAARDDAAATVKRARALRAEREQP